MTKNIQHVLVQVVGELLSSQFSLALSEEKMSERHRELADKWLVDVMGDDSLTPRQKCAHYQYGAFHLLDADAFEFVESILDDVLPLLELPCSGLD